MYLKSMDHVWKHYPLLFSTYEVLQSCPKFLLHYFSLSCSKPTAESMVEHLTFAWTTGKGNNPKPLEENCFPTAPCVLAYVTVCVHTLSSGHVFVLWQPGTVSSLKMKTFFHQAGFSFFVMVFIYILWGYILLHLESKDLFYV